MTNRYLFLMALWGCLLFTGKAFSQAKETNASLNGMERPAFTDLYPYAGDVVTGAIRQRLKKDGISNNLRKGQITSQGVQYAALSPGTIDLYFQIDEKGKRGKNGTAVNLFISKGQDHFISRKEDREVSRNAIRFLDDLEKDIAQYGLQAQIAEQQNRVDDRAKDYKKLLKGERKLESKRYNLQRDLSGETNPDKQDKYRKKLLKLERDLSSKKADIQETQRDLQRQKDQLEILQDHLRNTAGR
jgi:hypothetical protein